MAYIVCVPVYVCLCISLATGRITGKRLGKDMEGCASAVLAFAGGNEEEEGKALLGQ